MQINSLDKTIRLAGLVPESVVDGKGIRMTIFVQGCPHRCEGCHNPHTHDFDGGTITSVEEIAQKIMANPLLDGITLSGGEPFVFAAELAALAKFVHSKNMNVWCYSGYTFEELTQKAETDTGTKALLAEIDVLVDGRFELSKRNLMLPFRGSNNQRLIDMKKTRAANKLVLL